MPKRSKSNQMSKLFREYKVQSIDLFKNYEQNSRTHSEEQIQEVVDSINEYGYTNPILVDENNIIIAGHCRIEGARRCGFVEIPSIIIDGLTDVQKAALVIADNKLAINAGWDFIKLAEQMTFLKDNDYNTDLTGFKADEIATFMADVVPEFVGDEDDIPKTPVEPITKLGDVWLLGNHRLMCGDSTMIDDVENLMAGEKIILCFTSPPYTDQREYEGGLELSPDHISMFISSSLAHCEMFAINLGISRKENEIITYWDSYIKIAKDCGLKLLSWNIWDRSGFGYTIGQATAMFAIEHEFIFVFGKNKKELNRTIENKSSGIEKSGTIRQKDGNTTKVKNKTGTHRQLGTVIRLDINRYIGGDEHIHPATFPVSLPESYIEGCTGKNENVYDPFGGFGSTLIACEKTQRKCFMMELSPNYCDVIINRWEKLTGKKATLEVEHGAGS